MIFYSQHVIAFHSYKIKKVNKNKYIKTHNNSTRKKTSTDEQGVAVSVCMLSDSFYVDI